MRSNATGAAYSWRLRFDGRLVWTFAEARRKHLLRAHDHAHGGSGGGITAACLWLIGWRPRSGAPVSAILLPDSGLARGINRGVGMARACAAPRCPTNHLWFRG